MSYIFTKVLYYENIMKKYFNKLQNSDFIFKA